jgi:hypothetical protein
MMDLEANGRRKRINTESRVVLNVHISMLERQLGILLTIRLH